MTGSKQIKFYKGYFRRLYHLFSFKIIKSLHYRVLRGLSKYIDYGSQDNLRPQNTNAGIAAQVSCLFHGTPGRKCGKLTCSISACLGAAQSTPDSGQWSAYFAFLHTLLRWHKLKFPNTNSGSPYSADSVPWLDMGWHWDLRVTVQCYGINQVQKAIVFGEPTAP